MLFVSSFTVILSFVFCSWVLIEENIIVKNKKIKMTSNAQVYSVKVTKSETIQSLKEKVEKETRRRKNKKY